MISLVEGILPELDPSSPEYEFLSYFECCCSLGVKPSVKKFIRYQEQWGPYSE